jgi:hypothetical protein
LTGLLKICNYYIAFILANQGKINIYTLSCPSFHKPAPYIIPAGFCAALKEQIALLPTDPNGVSVALASGTHCGSLTNIRNAVNGIFVPVFPGDFRRNKPAV